MISRDDMLELTRRMTPSRTCISRIAGSYMDREGNEEGTFHIHFGKLSESEKKKNLEIAKAIPFAETNVQLKEYAFPIGRERKESMWQLLMALRERELKDDGLLNVLYEVLAEKYEAHSDYAIYVFYGTYDIPKKGTDKEWLEGSEEVYSFIIGAIAPLVGEYEPGKPEFGFLFPAFSDRSANPERIDIFHVNPEREQTELLYRILHNEKRPAVRLQMIVDAFEMADDEWTQFLDTEQMAIISIPDNPGMYTGMEDVTYMDGRTGQALTYDEIIDLIDDDMNGRYLRLPSKYDIHDYRSEAYRRIAVEWCEENRLKIIE